MSNYHVPANYTDAGKLFGMFEIRNGIEAVILSIPIIFLCLAKLPFPLTAKIIITMVITIPVGGFALIGINDDCLTKFLRIWFNWLTKRGVIFFRGTERLKRKAEKLK